MKKCLTIIPLILIFIHHTFGQTTLYTGNVLNSLNQPIKGAVVYRVNSTPLPEYNKVTMGGQFTLTDTQGKYQIHIVNSDLLQIWVDPEKDPKNFKLYQFRYDPFEEKGQLYPMQLTVSIHNGLNFNLDSLRVVKGLPFDRTGQKDGYKSINLTNGKYQLHHSKTPDFSTLGIDLSLSAYLTRAIDTQKSQKNYVQGYAKDGQLQQVETPFSWDPVIEPHIGTYDNKIFQTGHQHRTTLNLRYDKASIGKFSSVVDYNKTQGVLAPNRIMGLYTHINYKKNITNLSSIEGALSLHQTNEDFPLIGNNHAIVLMGAMLQPLNYDAKNNPTVITEQDNPWCILQQQKDYSKNMKYTGYVNYKLIDKDKWELKTNLNTLHQVNSMRFGQNSSPAEANNAIYFRRVLIAQQLSSSLLASYNLSDQFKIMGNAFWNEQTLSLKKDRYTKTMQSLPQMEEVEKLNSNKLNHYAVDLQTGLSFLSNYSDHLKVSFLNGLFFTNKSRQKSAYNLQAEIVLSKNFDAFNSYSNRIMVWAKSQISHTEPLQIQNDIQFSTLHQSITQFRRYLPEQELLLLNPLDRLQRKTNFEFGTKFNIGYNHDIGMNYYTFRVHNAYVPIFENESYSWRNAINYKQQGWSFWLRGDVDRNNLLKWNYNLTVNAYRNKTTSILTGADRIAIAGFQEINKNYILGQPLGVILGTAFKKNAEGKMIIVHDGYPVLDEQLQILGDPNPDFTVQFGNNLRHKSYSLHIHFDWSQGGKVWNGTQQTKHYYGKSEETGIQRNTVDYVFPGVDPLGNPNSRFVSFYDHNQDINQNRWVRYGIAGVAEDAIQDASYFRLSHLTFSKKIKINKKNLNEIQLGLFVENLLFFSAYKGYAPTSALLGQSIAIGLDYFNNPMQKTYGFNLKFAL